MKTASRQCSVPIPRCVNFWQSACLTLRLGMATAISGNQKLYAYTPDPTPLITLSYFVNLYSMFGIFTLGCGLTHLMEIWTLWNGTYRLAGVIKPI